MHEYECHLCGARLQHDDHFARHIRLHREVLHAGGGFEADSARRTLRRQQQRTMIEDLREIAEATRA